MFLKETTLSDRATSDFPDRDVEDQDHVASLIDCLAELCGEKKTNRSVQRVLYISYDEFRFF